MTKQGVAAASHASGVLAPPNVGAACRDFEAALGQGYSGAKFRVRKSTGHYLPALKRQGLAPSFLLALVSRDWNPAAV